MPDDGQPVHCSAGSLPAHGDEAGEGDEKEWGQLQLKGNGELQDVQENS